MPESLTLETESAIYVIFFNHVDFVDYINQSFPGRHLDMNICVPAIVELRPPHRIFLNLECLINNLTQNIPDWENLSDERKEDEIIKFLIININHESIHRAIFEAPEIRSYLEEAAYDINDATNRGMEYIVARIERD